MNQIWMMASDRAGDRFAQTIHIIILNKQNTTKTIISWKHLQIWMLMIQYNVDRTYHPNNYDMIHYRSINSQGQEKKRNEAGH